MGYKLSLSKFKKIEIVSNIFSTTTLDSVDMNFSKLWETVEDRGAWGAAVHEVAESDTP